MRPPLRSLRRRRMARRVMTVQIPDSASRQRGSGAGRPPQHLTRQGAGRRPAHLRVASETPLAAAPPRGGEAQPGSTPARGRRPHQSDDRRPRPQPGPAVRSSGGLGLALVFFLFATVLAAAIGEGAVAIAAGAASLAVLVAYRPPARGQVGRDLTPQVPAPRARAHQMSARDEEQGHVTSTENPIPTGTSGTRPRGLSAARLPAGSGAGSPGERTERMASATPPGPPGDPTP